MKKLLIFGFVFLALISGAFGEDLGTNLTACWSFDNVDVRNDTLVYAENYLDNECDLFEYNDDEIGIGRAGIASGESYEFADVAGLGILTKEIGEVFNETQCDMNLTGRSWTIALYATLYSNLGGKQFFAFDYAGSPIVHGVVATQNVGDSYMLYTTDSSTWIAELTDNNFWASGQTKFIGITWDGTNMTYYVNSTTGMDQIGVLATPSVIYSSLVQNFTIGGSFTDFKSSAGDEFDGLMDEYMVWVDRALTGGELSEISNNKYGCEEVINATSPPAPGGDSLNISANPQPIENESFDVQTVNFNISYNSSFGMNCSVYINDTINETTDNWTAGENLLASWNLSFPAGSDSYNYSIRCYDDRIRANTTGFNFRIDTVDPAITWTTPATDGSTVWNLFNSSTFITNILLSDANLYSYYYDINRSNGDLLFNYNKTTLTGLTSFTITNNSDIGYAEVLRATVKVCDGHTNNEIDFGVTKSNNELDFDGVNIYLNNKQDTSSLNYVKMDDRYSFSFTTKSLSTTKSFIVESENYIDILHGKTNYKGHLITGNKWIDFEMGGLKSVLITRLSDTKVRVDIESYLLTTGWNFNSIGELNCVTETKEFFTYNVSTTSETQAVVTDQTDFLLNIDYNSSFITSITADLNYNGTAYAASGSEVSGQYIFNETIPIPERSSDDNVSFYWNYTINSDEFNTSEENITIFVPSIDNCSSFTTRWINFSIIDEDTRAATNALIIYDFDFGYGNITGTLIGETTNDSSNYEFCMYPSFAKFTTNISIDYQLASTSTFSRSYLATSLAVNNTTQQVNLELLTNPTEITIHVIDDSDNNLETVLIRAYRYDVATDTDTLVQSEFTDSGGNAIFGLKTGTTRYSFKFYQDDVLELSTTRFKLFATEYEYVLSEAASTKLSEWILLDTGITRTLTYSNISNLVEFNWTYSGTLTDEFCLEVRGENFSSYYYGCSSNTTGSLSYTLATLNISYLAAGKVRTLNGNLFNLITKYIDSRDGWRTLGPRVSISMSILIFLVIFLICLVNKNVAIVGGLLALTVLSFFGIIPIATSILIPMIFVGIVILVIMNRGGTT